MSAFPGQELTSKLTAPYQSGPIVLRLPNDKSVLEFRKIEVKNLANTTSAPPLAIVPFDAAKAKEHQAAWAKHLGVPVEVTNSIGMKLQLIPPGEFVTGTAPEALRQLIER